MRRNFRFAWLLGTVLLLEMARSPIAQAKIVVGDEVPGLTLVNWSGQPVRLTDLRGKVVVIDFWASWCAVCRQALPALDSLSRRLGRGPVVVVGINIDQTPATADRFLRDYLPAPAMMLWRDPQAEALSRFGAEGMPAIYVVDPQGIVRLAESGYAPERLTAVEDIVSRYLPQAADIGTPPPATRD